MSAGDGVEPDVGQMVGVDRAELVYREHAVGLTRFATGLVGPTEAADVVSAAMVSCFSSPSWASVEDSGAYLYRAVVNQARSLHRSAIRREIRESRAASKEAITDPEAQPDLWAAVGRLSLRQRAVVMLTYVDDLTVAQVASRLGIGEGSVHRHLNRARNHLREVLHD